jgi:hypothetical protein
MNQRPPPTLKSFLNVIAIHSFKRYTRLVSVPVAGETQASQLSQSSRAFVMTATSTLSRRSQQETQVHRTEAPTEALKEILHQTKVRMEAQEVVVALPLLQRFQTADPQRIGPLRRREMVETVGVQLGMVILVQVESKIETMPFYCGELKLSLRDW